MLIFVQLIIPIQISRFPNHVFRMANGISFFSTRHSSNHSHSIDEIEAVFE